MRVHSQANLPIMLNLGCNGFKIYQPEMIILNVDLDPSCCPDVVADVKSMPCFSDNFADLIWASHLLEHIEHRNVVSTLKEWKRILKPSGQVQIVTPDVAWCIDLYYKKELTWDGLRDRICCQGEHKNIFRQEDLINLLQEAGFSDVKPLDLANCPFVICPDRDNPIPEPGQCGAVGKKP